MHSVISHIIPDTDIKGQVRDNVKKHLVIEMKASDEPLPVPESLMHPRLNLQVHADGPDSHPVNPSFQP